ncbi:hypothetical protein E2C01_046404 [Portunus trituberculatus]|uniref:Uncharacterized protein n=1 Tax=Portunus trituberculatus TaxID=210409 RepID=A0A5B7G5N6_PORTR|nr:hypothetical protein [Portunus trituberculatus]
MQQKCVPQKNSQNRRLLWEAFVEGNPPSYSDLKMTFWARSATSREPETLAAVDGVPRPDADQSF